MASTTEVCISIVFIEDGEMTRTERTMSVPTDKHGYFDAVLRVRDLIDCQCDGMSQRPPITHGVNLGRPYLEVSGEYLPRPRAFFDQMLAAAMDTTLVNPH